MLLEYMCEFLKLLTIQNPRKLSLKNKFKKRLNTEFPMLREKWPTFSITVNKFILPLQLNFVVRFKAASHFISRNLEAVDHPVPEITNYNDHHVEFSHKYTWILWQNYVLCHKKRWRIWICVFTLRKTHLFFSSSRTLWVNLTLFTFDRL